MNTAFLAAIVGITMALIEIVKALINKFTSRGDTDVTYWARELHSLCSKVDIEGTPLIYTPRSLAVTQKETLNLLQEVSHTQERIADILDRIEKRQAAT